MLSTHTSSRLFSAHGVRMRSARRVGEVVAKGCRDDGNFSTTNWELVGEGDALRCENRATLPALFFFFDVPVLCTFALS